MSYLKLNHVIKNNLIVLVLLIVFLFFSTVFFSWFFRNFSSNAEYLFSESKKYNGEMAKFLATIVVGILAFVTIWLNYRRTDAMQKQTINQLKQIDKITEQNELIRKGKIDERFKNAIDHLGSEKPTISLGGIHELHRITEEDNSYCSIVFDILCSFIREKSIHIKNYDKISKKRRDCLKSKVEFQTIINILFKENEDSKCTFRDISANLNGIKCYNSEFSEVKLSGARLNDAQLVGSIFDKAIFEKTELCRSNLENSNHRFTNWEYSHFNSAHLQNSKLIGVIFKSCNLQGAHFEEVDINGTSILDSDLTNIHFEGSSLKKMNFDSSCLKNSHFEGADLLRNHFEMLELENAHFEGAYLSNAHFEGAYLKNAHFEAAYLKNAHFEGAFLEGAHFEGAFLEGAHFEGAYSTNWIDNDYIVNFRNRIGSSEELNNTNQGKLLPESNDILLSKFSTKIKNQELVNKYTDALNSALNRETEINKETYIGILTKEKADKVTERFAKNKNN